MCLRLETRARCTWYINTTPTTPQADLSQTRHRFCLITVSSCLFYAFTLKQFFGVFNAQIVDLFVACKTTANCIGQQHWPKPCIIAQSGMVYPRCTCGRRFPRT